MKDTTEDMDVSRLAPTEHERPGPRTVTVRGAVGIAIVSFFLGAVSAVALLILWLRAALENIDL